MLNHVKIFFRVFMDKTLMKGTILYQYIKQINQRNALFSLLLGFIFSSFLILGKSINTTGFLPKINLLLILNFILITIIISMLMLIIFILLDKISAKEYKISKLNFWQIFGIILFFWIPLFFAFYPGVLAYDSPAQFTQIINNQFNTFQPIFHTSILRLFFLFGIKISNMTISFAIYTLFQLGIMAASFSYFLKSFQQYIPKYFFYMVITLIILSPTNLLFGVNIARDPIFTAMFIVCITALIKYAINKGISWKEYIIFVIAGIVIIGVRPNGLAIFAFITPFLIGISKFRKMAIIVLLTIILGLGATTILKNHFQAVSPDNVEEMSIPLQQTIRIIKYSPGVFDHEEMQLFTKNFGNKNKIAELYIPTLSDPLKYAVNELSSTKPVDKKTIIKLWLSAISKEPKIALEAFLNLNVGYWYPLTPYPLKGAEWHIPIETKWHKEYPQFGLKPQSFFPEIKNIYEAYGNNILQQKSWVLGLPLHPAPYFWLYLFVAFYSLYKKNYKLIIPLLFMAGIIISGFVAPIALIRYLYPLIALIIPLFVLSIFMPKTNE